MNSPLAEQAEIRSSRCIFEATSNIDDHAETKHQDSASVIGTRAWRCVWPTASGPFAIVCDVCIGTSIEWV